MTINWSDLVKSEEVLGKLHVSELDRYLAFHGLSENGKKGDKVSRIMAHWIFTKDEFAQTRVAPKSEAKMETEYHDMEDEENQFQMMMIVEMKVTLMMK